VTFATEDGEVSQMKFYEIVNGVTPLLHREGRVRKTINAFDKLCSLVSRARRVCRFAVPELELLSHPRDVARSDAAK